MYFSLSVSVFSLFLSLITLLLSLCLPLSLSICINEDHDHNSNSSNKQHRYYRICRCLILAGWTSVIRMMYFIYLFMYLSLSLSFIYNKWLKWDSSSGFLVVSLFVWAPCQAVIVVDFSPICHVQRSVSSRNSPAPCGATRCSVVEMIL